jgi:hypothetical protein
VTTVTFATVSLTMAVGKEKVTVSDDSGSLLVRCTCGAKDCIHAIAVELGSRAAVNPRDFGNLLAAGRIMEQYSVDVTVRLAEALMRLRRDPKRKAEADALQRALLDRLA